MSRLPLPANTSQPLELSYVSLAGEEVLPATRENVHLLQHAADYAVSVGNLKVSGIGDIIWGLICLAIGWINFRYSYLNAGLIALGVVLLCIGSWIIANPTPLGVIMDGSVLLLVALWNLAIFFLSTHLSHLVAQRLALPLVAIVQIGWGIHRIRAYRRFVESEAMRPSANAVQWLNALAQTASKAKPRKDPTLIHFARSDAWVAEKWRARLLPEIIVFVMHRGKYIHRRDILLASRDGIMILSEKKRLIGRTFRVKLRVGQRTLRILIPEESFDRLKNWMGQANPAPAEPTPPT